MNTPPPIVDQVPDGALSAQEAPPPPTLYLGPVSSLSAAPPLTLAALPPPLFLHVAPLGYELLDTIGTGGMGTVYRARDLHIDREVAVKILQEEYAPDSVMAARFVAEAKITGQLQHPGIPPVYHVGTLADGRPFLAMKLIKGQTLNQLLANDKQVAYLPILEAICHAVGYAHAHHVIHRDLKPANIMVGAFGEVQVMDWGLAKVLASGVASAPRAAIPAILVETHASTRIRPGRDSESQDTQIGSILGTPAYMAPEQAASELEKIDQRADVFGLGAILCTMLTGHPPYAGTQFAVLTAAVRGQTAAAFQRLDVCRAEPEVIALCKRCLSFEPADRPTNGNELAQAVAALRTAAEERAKQAELEKAKAEVREAEQRQRRRLLLVASLVVVSILLAGIIGITWGLLHAEEQRRLAEEQRQQAETARAKEAQQRHIADEQKEKAILARKDAEAAQGKTMDALRAATDDVVDKLIGSKQTLGPRERAYLEAALQRWQKFAAEQGDSVLARTMRAEGAFHVAQLQAKFGLRREAEAGYRTAISLWAPLAAEFPAVPDYRYSWARNHNNLGVLLTGLGKHAEAQRQYEQALALHKKLAAEFPAVAAYRRYLATHQDNLGLLLAGFGKGAEALAQCEPALALCARLAAEFPTLPAYRYELALSHNHLGFVLKGLGKRTEAQAQYQQGRTLLAQFATAFPTVPDYRFELGNCHNDLGNLLYDRGLHAEAQAQYEPAVALHAQLTAEFPAVPEYRQKLASHRHNLGLLLAKLGKGAEALAQYQQALALGSQLAAEFPTVPEYRLELAGHYDSLGNLLRDRGQHAEAQTQLGQALALLEKLVAEFPAVPLYRLRLAAIYNHLGLLLFRLGQWAEAQAQFGQALTLQTKLAAEFPTVPLYRQELAKSHTNLGNLLHGVGQLAQAQAQYEHALALRTRLVAQFPAVPMYQVELGGIYCNIANVVRGSDKPAESFPWYDKAIATLEPVVQQEPRYMMARNFLCSSYWGRAFTYDRLEQYAAAVKHWEKTIALAPTEDQAGYRANRAYSCWRAGQTAEALAEIAELWKVEKGSADGWYKFACFYAVANGKFPDQQQAFADRAMQLLHQAVQAGYKDAEQMKKNPDLDPLRNRPDFQKLLESLTPAKGNE